MDANQQNEAVTEVIRQLIQQNQDKAQQAQKTLHLSGWFVGQVMKQLEGKASPLAVHSMVIEELVSFGSRQSNSTTDTVVKIAKSKIARLIDPGAGWDRRLSNSENYAAEQYEAMLDRRQVEAEKIAERILAEVGTNTTRPAEFLAWAKDTYGPVAAVRIERLLRFVEEAIELAHADGVDREMLIAILDRVYSRPRGDINQEIAQSQVCLEMYAENIGQCADHLAAIEWQRVRTIPKEVWQERHAAKQRAGIAIKHAEDSRVPVTSGFWAPSPEEEQVV